MSSSSTTSEELRTFPKGVAGEEQTEDSTAVNSLSKNAQALGGERESNKVLYSSDSDEEDVEEDEEDDVDNVSLDSYGLPRYNECYPDEPTTTTVAAVTDSKQVVPWQLRKPDRRVFCTFFEFLRVPQFWKQFEFAARITLVPVLIPASLIAARLPHSPFVSPFMVISSTVLGAKPTIGEAVAYIFTWCRAGCFWLPLAVLAGMTGLHHHLGAWCVYYTVVLFIMAVFTEAMVRRICLLLFNSCVVGLLLNPQRTGTFPLRVFVDWSIGTLLCTVAAFLPYPIFCKNHAQATLKSIAQNTGTAFRGLVFSFWSPSNVERNMAMSKVRGMTESLDHLFPVYEHHQAFSFFEFFFETTEAREIRDVKYRFLEVLRVNLSSMTRVLDMVEANPAAIDDSERCYAFGEALRGPLSNLGEAFDELMRDLSHAKTKEAILNLAPVVEKFKQRTFVVERAFTDARRKFFYESTSPVLEQFVPLMTFYLFTIVCFSDTVEIFELKITNYKPSGARLIQQIVNKVAVQPFRENVEFAKLLMHEWKRQEVQRVIEAAKVSFAMILTIGFSFMMEIDKASFSGPNIIAFVSGMNPVEAVQASIVRLTGCLIGTVLGFFAGTFAENAVERVASLCTLMFIGTFLRNDKEYGVMAVYAMFVLIPLVSFLETTVDDTIARMNQNTFGIFIYLIVSIVVLPLSPSFILRMKRRNILLAMSRCMTEMMKLFSTPLASESALSESDVALQQLSNRSFHTIVRTDEPLEKLSVMLNDIVRRVRLTKEFMGFAKDERGLVEIDYPAKACSDTFMHMYRMTGLLRTMRMSWNVLRCQKRLTPQTRRIMAHLQPIAKDIAKAFEAFVNLMCYMLKDESINLEQDVMKAVLNLIEACEEFSRRKSEMILIVISESVVPYRDDAEKTGEDDNDEQSGQYSRALGTSPLQDHQALYPGKSAETPTAASPTDIFSPVHLPEDFQFPFTSEDAEGLHSFSVCLDMFANETKLLMMSLGSMMDVMRSKV